MILFLYDPIRIIRVIPNISLNDITHINVLVDSLIKAGFLICEIAFRNENAFEALKILSARNNIFLCTRNIFNINQAIEAINCGANYILNPGSR